MPSAAPIPPTALVNVPKPLATEPNPLQAVTIADNIGAIPLIADITTPATLNPISAFTKRSMASATSSGSTESIHLPNFSRKSANLSPLTNFAKAEVTRSMKITRPSPTVSMNGSR